MISHCVIVYNELDYIENLIQKILSNLQENEEFIIVHTYKNEQEILSDNHLQIKTLCTSNQNIKYYRYNFTNKFSDLKNYLISLSSKKYILNLDADEYFENYCYDILRKVIITNDIDLYYLPRVNIVKNITQEDVTRWGWNVNQKGWINWPDLQPRLFKNMPNIRWMGDVHERIVGFSSHAILEQTPIIHIKDIDRQRKQNELYDQISKGNY